MSSVWTIARKELSDSLRNRWLMAISLVFASLALGIAWFGAAASGQVGYASTPATIASLASLNSVIDVTRPALRRFFNRAPCPVFLRPPLPY